MSAADGLCGAVHLAPDLSETWICTRDHRHGGRWHEMEVDDEIDGRRWAVTEGEWIRPRVGLDDSSEARLAGDAYGA